MLSVSVTSCNGKQLKGGLYFDSQLEDTVCLGKGPHTSRTVKMLVTLGPQSGIRGINGATLCAFIPPGILVSGIVILTGWVFPPHLKLSGGAFTGTLISVAPRQV